MRLICGHWHKLYKIVWNHKEIDCIMFHKCQSVYFLVMLGFGIQTFFETCTWFFKTTAVYVFQLSKLNLFSIRNDVSFNYNVIKVSQLSENHECPFDIQKQQNYTYNAQIILLALQYSSCALCTLSQIAVLPAEVVKQA